MKIANTNKAFAAIKDDGSLVTWGSSPSGGDAGSKTSRLESGVIDVVGTTGPNSGAFAALKSDGSVVTWGTASFGGSSDSFAGADSGIVRITALKQGFVAYKANTGVVILGPSPITNPTVLADLSSDVVEVVGDSSQYAALKSNGSVVSFGTITGTPPNTAALSSDVVSLKYGPGYYFYALKSTGGLEVWGDAAVSTSIASGIQKVVGTQSAIVAIKTDGTVTAWGDSTCGGDITAVQSRLTDVVDLIANNYAVAARNSDGSVVVWGSSSSGGVAPSSLNTFLSSNIVEIQAFPSSFMAKDSNGRVEIWSGSFSIPTSVKPLLASDVVKVCLGYTHYFAIKQNGDVVKFNSTGGSVVATGATDCVTDSANYIVVIMSGNRVIYSFPADATPILEKDVDIADLSINNAAVAAITDEGKIITWGDAAAGGAPSSAILSLRDKVVTTLMNALNSFVVLTTNKSAITWGTYSTSPIEDVEKIVKSTHSFAALKSDGSIQTWGTPSEAIPLATAPLLEGIIDIGYGSSSFTALKSNGSVVTWPAQVHVTMAGPLSSGVIGFMHGSNAVLLKSDSVVTWGTLGTSDISGLSSGVTKVVSGGMAHAALRSDGSVVTWGHDAYGGKPDSATATKLSSGVLDIFSNGAYGCFAAIKNDGSVVTWGQASAGGDSTNATESLTSGIASIHQLGGFLYAKKINGDPIWWGPLVSLSEFSSIASFMDANIVDIAYTSALAVALKNDGTTRCWGGYVARCSTPVLGSISSGVKKVVYHSDSGPVFAFLKEDGSVAVVNASSGAITLYDSSALSSGVTDIFAGGGQLLALKENGSVALIYAYDTKPFEAVESQLSAGVYKLISASNNAGVAALKADGSMVTWGTDAINHVGNFSP